MEGEDSAEIEKEINPADAESKEVSQDEEKEVEKEDSEYGAIPGYKADGSNLGESE